MRVPDILHAVQKQGWTQVLHRCVVASNFFQLFFSPVATPILSHSHAKIHSLD